MSLKNFPAFWIVLLAGFGLAAEPKSPPPPKTYDAIIRYRIQLTRGERIRQFDGMERYLRSIGFDMPPVPVEKAGDFDDERLSGRIPSGRIADLLQTPYLRCVLLTPVGWDRPAEPNTRVKVRLELVGNLPRDRQRALARQSLEHLRLLGFVEQIGYDHRDFTRLRGTIAVSELDNLLKDLRGQPAGWLMPETPTNRLPEPLRSFSPIRLIEVVPEPADAPPALPPVPPPPLRAAGADYLAKLTPALRAALATNFNKPLRLEVILARTPPDNATDWQRVLQSAARGIWIEGRIGPIVAVHVAEGRQADELARLAEVDSVRLPRTATQSAAPSGPVAVGFDPLEASRLDRLHRLGRRGEGLKVLIVSDDFAGLEAVRKTLPAKLTWIDLTAERSPDLLGEPLPADRLGTGTRAALTAARAAPDATFLLVRVTSAGAYQMLNLGRLLIGPVFLSDSMRQRYAELQSDEELLQQRRAILLQRRKETLDRFATDEQGIQKRQQIDTEIAAVDKEEAALTERKERYLRLQENLKHIRGTDIVISAVLWSTGYGGNGASSLSQWLDEHLTVPRPQAAFRGLKRQPKVMWFQSAGDTQGQIWAGYFRDKDGDGVLEFGSQPAPQRWTNQLNFLGFQPRNADPSPDLPENSQLRLVVQWTEAHDPDLFDYPEDVYREPLTDVQVLLLRQRDPEGQGVPSDELELVGRSLGLPQRVEHRRHYSTYEQVLEVKVPVAGRYALRVEGRPPLGLRPASVVSLAGSASRSELKARVVVEALDAPTAAKGKPIFLDAFTAEGGVGMPGDATAVVTVGAADPMGRVRKDSMAGVGPDVTLQRKPNVIAYDTLPDGQPGGSAAAAGWAGGFAATLISDLGPRDFFLSALDMRPGQLLILPDRWIDKHRKERSPGHR